MGVKYFSFINTIAILDRFSINVDVIFLEDTLIIDDSLTSNNTVEILSNTLELYSIFIHHENLFSLSDTLLVNQSFNRIVPLDFTDYLYVDEAFDNDQHLLDTIVLDSYFTVQLATFLDDTFFIIDSFDIGYSQRDPMITHDLIMRSYFNKIIITQ